MTKARNIVKTLLCYLAFAVIVLLATLYSMSTTWPEAEIWHEVRLDEEFTRAKLDEVRDFQDYLALEERLFQELEENVLDKTPNGSDHRFERYSKGSAADPMSRQVNWNRSFELTANSPRGAVLLLHGMSDSPYSLRAIGQTLNNNGYHVLGLRLPGHGTIPSGLLKVHWRDMAAATRLAMEHLARTVPGKPLHMIGYSTGAPLAIDYALTTDNETGLSRPASLVLLSPAIGVSPAARLAKWKRRLSYLPGLNLLAWLDIMPEFDPYKYNSFATNAGEQVYRLTKNVAARIKKRKADTPLPPILVLKSTVDATTSTIAVVDRLLVHLEAERHEFVLFDINRHGPNTSLLVSDPGPVTQQLVGNGGLPFTLTVVGNINRESMEVAVRDKPPFSMEMSRPRELGASWPETTLSLSHIALPFPLDDPLYGREHPGNPDEIFLGHVVPQAERGLLRFSSTWLIRLRHNPFYDYTEQRIIDWVAAAEMRD